MRDVMFYVAKALQNGGFSSERQLCEVLGLSHAAITHYRKGGVLPGDETMIRLARIAGINPDIALLDLNSWRSEGEAQKTYLKMLEKITAAAIALCILAAPLPVNASPDCQMINRDLYIMAIIRAGLRTLKLCILRLFQPALCTVLNP